MPGRTHGCLLGGRYQVALRLCVFEPDGLESCGQPVVDQYTCKCDIRVMRCTYNALQAVLLTPLTSLLCGLRLSRRLYTWVRQQTCVISSVSIMLTPTTHHCPGNIDRSTEAIHRFGEKCELANDLHLILRALHPKQMTFEYFSRRFLGTGSDIVARLPSATERKTRENEEAARFYRNDSLLLRSSFSCCLGEPGLE